MSRKSYFVSNPSEKKNKSMIKAFPLLSALHSNSVLTKANRVSSLTNCEREYCSEEYSLLLLHYIYSNDKYASTATKTNKLIASYY